MGFFCDVISQIQIEGLGLNATRSDNLNSRKSVELSSVKNDASMFGRYGKLKTGRILEIKAWDNLAPRCEVIDRNGSIQTVGSYEIIRLSADEELAFMQSDEH